MLENQRLDGCVNTAPSLTSNRIGGAIMASAIHATNPSFVQTCRFCQANEATLADGFCSLSCRNRSRADHSTETLMLRFWAKVDKTPGLGPNGDCWHWTARVDGRGYGEIKVAGKYKKAHRLSLFGRDNLNDERFACHRCDNPICVRPDHLFPGEAVDNVRDMIAKGRSRAAGCRETRRKLTADQVREIRTSGLSQRKMEKLYGVSRISILGILRGDLYKDVM